MPMYTRAFKKGFKNMIASQIPLDFFDVTMDPQEHSISTSSRPKEGVVRFDDGQELKCSRSDIQFKYADHLHYGSFGDLVTRAVHAPTNRNIAVKIVRIFDRLSGRNEGRSMQDILRKMETANRMKHENIIRLYGFIVEEMTCYMVMERMEASLAEVIQIIHSDHISKCSISELENVIGSMIVDVVAALEFLSERQLNIVLSPKRILLGNDGKAKIAVSSAFPNGGVPPVRYSSPELLESNHAKDYSKTGVWSLGIILIEAATGKYPYSGSIDFVIADQIIEPNQRPRLGENFSMEMTNFVDACLLHSVQTRASVCAADENCLQNTQFYRVYAQRANRCDSVKAILHRVQPHLEELRKE